MLIFKIHLKTMKDFQKYVGLFENFRLSGFTGGKDFHARAEDILEISCHDSLDDLQLILRDYRQEDVTDIKNYMFHSGLLKNIQYL